MNESEMVTSKTLVHTVLYSYDAAWKDKLTAVGGQSITYDAQGNPTCYLGHALSWEKGRQLKSFDNIQYTYNANGIRTSKTVNGVKHTYLLDGTKILRETWGEHTLFPLYDNEESVCGIVYNDVPYYFLKNLQGDILSITDADAQVVAKYRYDAWGVCTVTEDTTEDKVASINPFRYRGYYYDAEIGLYYVSSRYYDPEIGRFLNADDFSKLSANGVVFDYNTFSYCKNNSVCNKDEYGYFGTPVQWLFAAIGAVAGWFLGDYIAKKLGYYSGWKYWAIRVGVVVGGAVIGWFAAKLLTKILQSFLNANKAIYNKLPRLAKKFLGLKCFVAGTLVSTANGEVKIEEISVGDYVLTYNFDTGNTEYNKVLQVFKNTTDILTCVCFDDEEIVSTPSHRYYVAEKGWIKAKDLQPGDKLILYDNSTKAVKSVYTKRSSIAVPVYNLNVENQHNYFVSKYQVLVHNLGCEDVATNTLKKISKAQIKKLGGEKVTREIKKQFGKSLSNLYVDAKGNVYVSVNGSKIAQ